MTAPSTKAARAGRQAPRLTHPDRVLWPDSGLTKRDLAGWFEAAAPRLLPMVAGRALTLVRAPRGLDGPRFVQRHPSPALGRGVSAVPVAGQPRPYLTLEDRDGLLALAQASVIEIHPTGARLEDFERPDRLVLDLDPAEDVGFDTVVAAAQALRRRLEALGLAPFCRTTGGKGLHLVAPLVPLADWAEAKALARDLCAALAAEAPDRFTTSPVRAEREGRVFLDYLRNDRLATAIASWSPRAKPGAPVAMPLAWEAVAEGRLSPQDFTLRTAHARLAEADPWEGFQAAAVPLTSAMRNRFG
jgi:bifunctional non-homologous end joining protein LigD